MLVLAATLPDDAFLQTYAQRGDCYTDCYCIDVQGPVSLEQLLMRFYQTPLFRAERLVLKLFARRPSTDADVAALAKGAASKFAAWDVEDRAEDQILLCDMSSRTRSWFMTRAEGDMTKLYFGSAVVPPEPDAPLGVGFSALLGPHKLYSRLLLSAAGKRLT